MRPSGLVVSDSGWACSEWVAAGAAGDASAAEGVAGESSMLPWDEAGLSHIFSEGRYCTHCFLLLMEKSEGQTEEKELRHGAAGAAAAGAAAGGFTSSSHPSTPL